MHNSNQIGLKWIIPEKGFANSVSDNTSNNGFRNRSHPAAQRCLENLASRENTTGGSFDKDDSNFVIRDRGITLAPFSSIQAQ